MAEITRRHLLAATATPLFAQSGEKPLSFPGKRPMLVHNDFPEDLESPPEYFTSWITPLDAFFVRQHLPRPRIVESSYKLDVGGMVSKPSVLSLAELRKMPQHKVVATLECAGNGRAYYRPRLPGLQWTKGAIGNAEWRGPRIKDILAAAGLDPNAQFVDFDGADVGVGKTPDFIRSIPMRKAQHDSTILALEMNGRPLPDLHGFPARLIVPGWDGASWVKWVTSIKASAASHSGFYMATAYRYPKNPVGPGGAAKPDDMEVIEGMAVKSFFAWPLADSKLQRARVPLRGVAWAGEHRIAKVEVSADGGATWIPAELGKDDVPFAWRLWNLDWTPARSGHHVLCCRATDVSGRTQPIEAPWNPSGYLWNGIDRVGVMVEG